MTECDVERRIRETYHDLKSSTGDPLHVLEFAAFDYLAALLSPSRPCASRRSLHAPGCVRGRHESLLRPPLDLRWPGMRDPRARRRAGAGHRLIERDPAAR